MMTPTHPRVLRNIADGTLVPTRMETSSKIPITLLVPEPGHYIVHQPNDPAPLYDGPSVDDAFAMLFYASAVLNN